MDEFTLLAVRAAQTRAEFEKMALSFGTRARAGLEGAKRWVTGDRFADLSKARKIKFPEWGGEQAAGEEASHLAQQGQRTWLKNLNDTPYFHLRDRLVGGAVGAPAGYLADQATFGDVESSSDAARRLLATGGGFAGGGKALNALGNVGRKYLANTTQLYGYGAANVSRPTLRKIWDHGVMDRPGESAFYRAGKDGPVTNVLDPRHELFRRYLGIHSDDAAKDYFVRRADRSLGFNPETTGPGTEFWKRNIEPTLGDERFKTRFVFKEDRPMQMTDLPQNTRTRVQGRLDNLREAARKAKEEADQRAAAASPPRPSILLGNAPAGPRPSLFLGGQPQPPAKPVRLEVPGETPHQEAAGKLSLPGLSEAKPPINIVDKYGDTPLVSRRGSFRHDPTSQPQAPRYSTDAGSNPMSPLLGSHDMRDVPSLNRERMLGGYSKGVEVGDVWNLGLPSWEKEEFGRYARGLLRTSPSRWKDYLLQDAALAHPDAVVGAMPKVGPRMASMGMRSVADNLVGKEAPVVQQKMRFDYHAPSAKNVTTDRLYVSPTSASLVNDVPHAPISGPTAEMSQLRRWGLGGAGVLGAGAVAGPVGSAFSGPPNVPAPPPAVAPEPSQPEPGYEPQVLPSRMAFRRNLADRAKSVAGNFWRGVTERYGGNRA